MRNLLKPKTPSAYVARFARQHQLPVELAQRILEVEHDLSVPTFARAVLDALLVLSSNIEAEQRHVPLYSIQAELYRRGVCLSDRSVKGAVKHLVEECQIAIGASRQVPYGYFFITSGEQAEKAATPLLAEIRSLVKRCKVLSPRSNYVRHLLGQLEVDL